MMERDRHPANRGGLISLAPDEAWPFRLQILNQPCDAIPSNRVHHWIDNPSVALNLGVEFVAFVTHAKRVQCSQSGTATAAKLIAS
jgi:hypothetical protein